MDEVKELVEGLFDSDVEKRRKSANRLYLIAVNNFHLAEALDFENSSKQDIGLAVEPLIEALEDEDIGGVRIDAAYALIYSKSYSALKPFLESLKLEQIDNLDSEQMVMMDVFKNLVVLGLGRITSKDSIEPLVELLQDESTPISLKVSAIISLTRLIVEFHWNSSEDWAPFTFIFGGIYEKYEGSEGDEKYVSKAADQANMILWKELGMVNDISLRELVEHDHISRYNLDRSLFRLFDYSSFIG
jgi:HEAT repeat protein